jgi:hypothetical protein
VLVQTPRDSSLQPCRPRARIPMSLPRRRFSSPPGFTCNPIPFGGRWRPPLIDLRLTISRRTSRPSFASCAETNDSATWSRSSANFPRAYGNVAGRERHPPRRIRRPAVQFELHSCFPRASGAGWDRDRGWPEDGLLTCSNPAAPLLSVARSGGVVRAVYRCSVCAGGLPRKATSASAWRSAHGLSGSSADGEAPGWLGAILTRSTRERIRN